MIDPLNHYGTEPDKVAVPYYPPHPITERIALTVFPNARPIHVAPPPAGEHRAFSRPAARTATAGRRRPPATFRRRIRARPMPKTAVRRHFAVAVEGLAGAPRREKPFRLVLAGTSKFATN